MRLSLQVQYAICGIFDLAYNGAGEPVQVRVIGERQRIPTRYLEQIFQRLRRARLVCGKRGPGGGYTLGRAASQISVRDVVEAIEGPIVGGELEADDREGGSYRPDFLWGELARRVADVLSETTVESLCREASQGAVRRSEADAYTYQI